MPTWWKASSPTPEMKSHAEILAEAHRLEQLGDQYANEGRRAMAELMGGVPAPRFLLTFPESRVTASAADVAVGDEDESENTALRRRWVEVGWEEGAIEYRLIEDETETTQWGAVVRETGPCFVLGSDSAFDVLVTGYQRAEEDRLGELLAPYAERAETGEMLDAVDPALIREVEMIIGAGELSAASRIAAKAGIIAFLEGRIDASEFIDAAVSLGSERHHESERVEQRLGEQITIDHP